ncbi:MAG TPA: hypothetical protein VF669_00250 [Tepidisphaeraceae bacterium]|jgi:hypothetical protein
MNLSGLFNFRAQIPVDLHQKNERIVIQKVLHRVLAFTELTIDDVVNSPVAKRKVAGYYKLHNWVKRESEVSDLERQWNRAKI